MSGALQVRDYQQSAITSSWRALQKQRSTLVVMPTGSGKTFVFAKLIAKWIRQFKQRALVLADRQILVEQAAATIRDIGLSVDIEMGERSVGTRSLPQVVCGTVQSVSRRLGGFPDDAFGLIVIDEADLAMAPSYRRVTERFPSAKLFGCTATPNRHDGLALSGMFESVAHQTELADLVRRRYLVPIKRRAVIVLDLRRVRTRDGDFDPKQLDKILKQERELHGVVKPTLNSAGDRPTVVFGTSIEHCERLAAVFNRYRKGSARAVHSKSIDRDQILADFRAGKFQFLCNCQLISRGVDIPKISCIVMARPTQSLTLYMQALGRGTRLARRKRDLLILDHTSNSEVHNIISAVDALGGELSKEELQHAKDISEDGAEHDVTETLDRAITELANDAELRERVKAKVRFQTRNVVGIDWASIDWATKSNAQIARETKVSPWHVRCHRPPDIRSPRWQKRAHSVFVDWDSQPLGKASDHDIATKLNIDYQRVGYQRKLRGIPAYDPSPVIDWGVAGLGEKSDPLIAKEIGITPNIVRRKRISLGIRSYADNRQRKLQSTIATIGTTSDSDISKLTDLSHSRIAVIRRKLGIKSYRQRITEVVRNIADEELRTIPAEEIARKLALEVSTVRKERKRRGINSPWQIAKNLDQKIFKLLGKFPDRVLADRLGCTASVLAGIRAKHNIPAFRGRGVHSLSLYSRKRLPRWLDAARGR